MKRMILAVWDYLFGETVRRVEAESLAHRTSTAGANADWKTVVALLTTALCLTLQNFADRPYSIVVLLQRLISIHVAPGSLQAVCSRLDEWDDDALARLTWWACVAYTAYVIIPGLVIKLVFRERIIDYGVKLRGVLGGWPIYAVFVAVMAPTVWLVSADAHFQATYPFYKVSRLCPGLLRWEILYAFQFVALEFFFRGFVVHGTKHRFGVYSVVVMTVPYCMIHFLKPFPECMGSIVAGVVLGMMSLKTGSVWLGAALHISVAWGMDAASLYRRGVLMT